MGEPGSDINAHPARRAQRGSIPVTVRAPEVVAISEDNYQQAVAALGAMIATWWRAHHDGPTQPGEQGHSTMDEPNVIS